jgi:hypothetical protein
VANEQHLHVSLKGVKDVFNLVFGEHVIAEPGHTKGRKVQVNNCAGNCVVSSAHNDTTHGTCEQTTHTPQFKTHKRIRPQDEVSDGSTGTKEMRTASAQNTKRAQTTTTIHGGCQQSTYRVSAMSWKMASISDTLRSRLPAKNFKYCWI